MFDIIMPWKQYSLHYFHILDGGVGDIFGVIASKKIGGYSATFWSFATRAVVLTAYLPFILTNIHHLTLTNTLFTAFLSLLFITGSIFFFEACNRANVSLVGAIGAAYAVPAIIISVIFLHESQFLKLSQLVLFSLDSY